MKTHKNTYEEVISLTNLIHAWKKARTGKTKKDYVISFEENLAYNLKLLYGELKSQTYKPHPLKTFILRDPKTRKISKSAFRDRIVHHALIRIIEPILERGFLYDSCANRIGKGTSFALKRLDSFKRKVTNNLSSKAFCLKADIKHYFQEVDRTILLGIISKKIVCEKTLNLIKLILSNFDSAKGMPLGNLTSQFFANVYLNELDKFMKHKLKVKYYIRYVDDFVILHKSKEQLEIWQTEINNFLMDRLKIQLHSDKSRVINISSGVDFVGFRNFYYHRLLRKRNIKKVYLRIKQYKNKELNKEKFLEAYQGWGAYAKWANTYNLRKKIVRQLTP